MPSTSTTPLRLQIHRSNKALVRLSSCLTNNAENRPPHQTDGRPVDERTVAGTHYRLSLSLGPPRKYELRNPDCQRIRHTSGKVSVKASWLRLIGLLAGAKPRNSYSTPPPKSPGKRTAVRSNKSPFISFAGSRQENNLVLVGDTIIPSLPYCHRKRAQFWKLFWFSHRQTKMKGLPHL